jgi:arginine decarboxylase
MKTKYIDFVEQQFNWPQEEFRLENEQLEFHNIPLMELVKKYGTPLKFTYLPKISDNIQRAKKWFNNARTELNYEGEYHYCYCTKSSHFRHVLEEVLKNNVHLETSSAYDIDLIKRLATMKKLQKTQWIICNGFKKEEYVDRILDLRADGYENIMPVIDNSYELEKFKQRSEVPLKVGVRIASEEEPKFEFYTSRLGIGYKYVKKFYQKYLADDEKLELKMLHFFINSGIKDTAY